VRYGSRKQQKKTSCNEGYINKRHILSKDNTRVPLKSSKAKLIK
jgi:hypothetical protein